MIGSAREQIGFETDHAGERSGNVLTVSVSSRYPKVPDKFTSGWAAPQPVR